MCIYIYMICVCGWECGWRCKMEDCGSCNNGINSMLLGFISNGWAIKNVQMWNSTRDILWRNRVKAFMFQQSVNRFEREFKVCLSREISNWTNNGLHYDDQRFNDVSRIVSLLSINNMIYYLNITIRFVRI